MGLGGISIWQLLIVLAIIILLFGTKRLKSFGSDLGSAVKGFRKTMHTEEHDENDDKQQPGRNTTEDNKSIDTDAENLSNTDNKEKRD